MKKRRPLVLILFVLLSGHTTVFAQQPGSSFLSPCFGMEFPRNRQTVNFGLSAAGRLGGGPLYAGLGIQATKFDNNSNWYAPLFINLLIVPKTKSSAFPVIAFRPGYGLYSETKRLNNKSTIVSGSFTAFWGLGAGFNAKKQPYILAGYNSYGFDDAGVKSSINAFSVKAGIFL